MRAQSAVYYSVEKSTVSLDKASEGVVTASLNLASETDGKIAQTLNLTLTFYQNGMMRTLIEEPNTKRFRISQDDLEPIVESQLTTVDLTGLTVSEVDGLTVGWLDGENKDE